MKKSFGLRLIGSLPVPQSSAVTFMNLLKKQPLLCTACSKSLAIPASSTKSKFPDKPNLILEYGNGFKTNHKFTIFVSNLPYSMSKVSIEWLLQKKITRAVVMVQKEFAEKLTGNREHKAISILANYGFEIKFLMNVKKSNFYPPPKVDSVVILLKPKKVLSKVLISTVNEIFSFRRKTVTNILKHFDITFTSKKRLDDLSGDEIIRIAKKIIRN